MKKSSLYFFQKRFFFSFRKWNFLAPSLKSFLYFRKEFPKLKKLKKKHSEKCSYIFSKTAFLVFQEIELSSPKIRKFREGTFQAQKIKKPKKFLIYLEMELSCSKLKKLIFFSKKSILIFQEKICKVWKA